MRKIEALSNLPTTSFKSGDAPSSHISMPPFKSREKLGNSAKLNQCIDSLARVNSERANESSLFKYQSLRKSAYFDGFHIFQDAILVDKPKELIPTALKAIDSQLSNSPKLVSTPSLVKSYQDFDKLVRLSNLVDISNRRDLYLIITIHPETRDSFMPPAFYPNPPRYYEMRTCHNAIFSEYIHVTEESYRCVHDMNREEPTRDWPMDRPRYHLPTLVVTRNAEITDRGELMRFRLVCNKTAICQLTIS